jgi:hypothetical protein
MIMISSVDDHHHDHQHHDHHDHRFRKNCLYLSKVRLGFRVNLKPYHDHQHHDHHHDHQHDHDHDIKC